MNNYKVSIIIPCYNSEKFIQKTIHSVINQKYTNWECIIINDGSQDNTEFIAKKAIQDDSRLSIISQKNSGLSVSRNIGINNANGDFIYFLDADDLLNENSIQNLVNLASNQKNADIIIGKTAITFGQNLVVEDHLSHYLHTNKLLTNEDLNLLTAVYDYPISCIAPNKLYKLKFIRETKLTFAEKKLHEDELWFFEVLLHCNSIILSDEVTYYYNQNNTNSITQNRTTQNIFDYLSHLDKMFSYYLNETKLAKKNNLAKYIFSFKKNIYHCYTVTNNTEREKTKKIIQKKFNSLQVEINTKFENKGIEKYYYKFYVLSFCKPKTITKYYNFIDSKKNQEKLFQN